MNELWEVTSSAAVVTKWVPRAELDNMRAERDTIAAVLGAVCRDPSDNNALAEARALLGL